MVCSEKVSSYLQEAPPGFQNQGIEIHMPSHPLRRPAEPKPTTIWNQCLFVTQSSIPDSPASVTIPPIPHSCHPKRYAARVCAFAQTAKIFIGVLGVWIVIYLRLLRSLMFLKRFAYSLVQRKKYCLSRLAYEGGGGDGISVGGGEGGSSVNNARLLPYPWTELETGLGARLEFEEERLRCLKTIDSDREREDILFPFFLFLSKRGGFLW